MPGSDLAVAVEVRNDNSGPHTIPEIDAIYAGLRQQFPNASIRAANLTEIANAVTPFRNNLPIVTQEIGDTWIYGAPSDPLKVARYREVLRLRRSWIANGTLKVADATRRRAPAQILVGSRTHVGHRYQNVARFRSLYAT